MLPKYNVFNSLFQCIALYIPYSLTACNYISIEYIYTYTIGYIPTSVMYEDDLNQAVLIVVHSRPWRRV